MTRRDMDHFIRRLRRDGFEANVGGGGHRRITHPDIPGPIFAATTPELSESAAEPAS